MGNLEIGTRVRIIDYDHLCKWRSCNLDKEGEPYTAGGIYLPVEMFRFCSQEGYIDSIGGVNSGCGEVSYHITFINKIEESNDNGKGWFWVPEWFEVVGSEHTNKIDTTNFVAEFSIEEIKTLICMVNDSSVEPLKYNHLASKVREIEKVLREAGAI